MLTVKERLLAKIREANDSGTTEGRAVAEIVADQLAAKDTNLVIIASLDAVIGWAEAFKKEALRGKS